MKIVCKCGEIEFRYKGRVRLCKVCLKKKQNKAKADYYRRRMANDPEFREHRIKIQKANAKKRRLSGQASKVARTYYYYHSKKIIARNVLWKKNNPENARKYAQKYRDSHREIIYARNKAYYEANKEKIKEQKVQFCIKNKERMKKYYHDKYVLRKQEMI
jgi:hypothetical protein